MPDVRWYLCPRVKSCVASNVGPDAGRTLRGLFAAPAVMPRDPVEHLFKTGHIFVDRIFSALYAAGNPPASRSPGKENGMTAIRGLAADLVLEGVSCESHSS